jgi:ABC-type transport system involved in multi-copper enzyme maturation permease subunit
VSPVQEVYLVTQRELRKNLTSWKGIALLVLSVLAGGGASLLNVLIERFSNQGMPSSATDAELDKAELFKRLFALCEDKATAEYLANSSQFEWVLAYGMVIALPLVVAIIGFDAISTDMRHRTLRFWSVRCRRPSLFIGRFLGIWATVCAMLLMTSAVVWLVLAIGGTLSVGHILLWGFRYWSMCVPIAGAWCAVAMLVGSQFRGSFLALLAIASTVFVVTILKGIGYLAHGFVVAQRLSQGAMEVSPTAKVAQWLEYISPNSLDFYILSPTPSRLLIGVGGCVAFMVLAMGAGTFIFTKRDV